jgi:arsenite transporter
MSLTDTHHSSRFHLVSEHVRKYLIVYTIISVTLAVPVGYYSREFTAANKELFSNLVIFFAILTIYPSMIQLKTEGLAKSFRLWKPILVSLAYVFILSPAIAFIVAPSFDNAQLGVGFHGKHCSRL